MESSFYLPTNTEIRKFDENTIALGTPSIELMNRAGKGIYEKLKEEKGSYLIYCGSGNNGGDGLVLARELINNSCSVSVVVASSEKYSPDFIFQLQELKDTKVFSYPEEAKVINLEKIEKKDLKDLIEQSEYIVDALLGSGQKEAPRGSILEILKLETNAFNVAIDSPTGVNADTGYVYKNFFNADLTICIELIKRGLLARTSKKLLW